MFCHTAIESAQADKEIAVMVQMEKEAAHVPWTSYHGLLCGCSVLPPSFQVRGLKCMFSEMDADGSNMVSVDELKASEGSTL